MAKKTYSKKYKVGDEVVPGVTTIIKSSLGWGTQALIGWAVKITKEGGDHRKAMESAADSGTLAHSMVEHYCRKALGLEVPAQVDTDGYTEEQIKAATNAFDAFLMWKEGTKLSIVGTEIEVISPSLKYGGSIDLVFEDPTGRRHICDIKTTNYLLPDHLIQVAAYSYAYHETEGSMIASGHLLRFNKGNATTFHHTQWSTDALKLGMDAFKNLRSLYDLKKQVEGVC